MFNKLKARDYCFKIDSNIAIDISDANDLQKVKAIFNKTKYAIAEGVEYAIPDPTIALNVILDYYIVCPEFIDSDIAAVDPADLDAAKVMEHVLTVKYVLPLYLTQDFMKLGDNVLVTPIYPPFLLKDFLISSEYGPRIPEIIESHKKFLERSKVTHLDRIFKSIDAKDLKLKKLKERK
jgi:hypothetical protein